MTKQELAAAFEALQKAIKEFQDSNKFSVFNRMLEKVDNSLTQAVKAFGVPKPKKFTTVQPTAKIQDTIEKPAKVEEDDDSVVLADNSETREGEKKARKRRKKADDTSND